MENGLILKNVIPKYEVWFRLGKADDSVDEDAVRPTHLFCWLQNIAFAQMRSGSSEPNSNNLDWRNKKDELDAQMVEKH